MASRDFVSGDEVLMVPPGRAAGEPALRGVPKGLAAMLGVPTSWPDTGAISWLEIEGDGNEASALASRR